LKFKLKRFKYPNHSRRGDYEYKGIDLLNPERISSRDDEFKLGYILMERLYPSKEFSTKLAGDDYSVDKIINNYLEAVSDSRKLNLGLPFYARIPRVAVEAAPDDRALSSAFS
jgi:hypothetical protein